MSNPNGGVPNPQRPAKRLGDAAVFGLRGTATFWLVTPRSNGDDGA